MGVHDPRSGVALVQEGEPTRNAGGFRDENADAEVEAADQAGRWVQMGVSRSRTTTALGSVAMAAALVAGGLLAGVPRTTAPAAAAAAEQTWEVGVVDHVSDGDTVAVDVTWASQAGRIAPPASTDPAVPSPRTFCDDRLDADGTMPDDGSLESCRVRLIGVQAPETPGASGSALEQCRASAATSVLAARLPPGTSVQLRSVSAATVDLGHSGGRLLRSVWARDAQGVWVDVARAVLGSGEAMWFPVSPDAGEALELTHNLEYRRLVDAAAAARRGLWSPDHCGPSRPASLRSWVVSNPIGSDSAAEYAVLQNTGSLPLDVGGWTVRDTSMIWTRFPAGTVIPPGDHVRVWSGAGSPGSPTARDFHFGGDALMFANWDPSGDRFVGDGLYVFDVQPGYAYGNLRSWFHYPCDGPSCADPLVGRVVFGGIVYDPAGADTAAAERIQVRNVSAAAVRLDGYALTRQGGQFAFPPGTSIPAGGILEVSVGTGTDTPTRVHMGRASSLLANTGDLVAIENLNHASVDCRAWGAFSCAGRVVSGPLRTTPVTPTPTPSVAGARPGAPRSVTVRSAYRRIRASWLAPAPSAAAPVTLYRVRVYRRVDGTLRLRAACYARPGTPTCRTVRLVKGLTYLVRVQARNAAGYGPPAPLVRIRVR